MKIYLMEIEMSSAKLRKNFKANVCCPTPKHVTTQLFRNIHYQEFYYTGRQIQLKLKTDVFFMEIVDKSVRHAISSHNDAFLDTFHNAMKEAIH